MKFSRVKQFLKSKKVIRTGACVLAAVIVTGGVGAYHVYGQKAKTAQETTQERDADTEDRFADAEDVLTQVLKTQTKTDNDAAAEKEETVYVVADPDGTPNEVIVSDWLKNYLGADTIEDVSDLTDIENVKGDEKFTQNADGTLTWQADGNDIYYQGKTDRDLPIEMKMTYYLDGEEITPEELAGKSGKVTIRADYTNKEKAENGVYVPFAAVTGMMLNKNFTNVEVTNGKVVSDGNNQVVVGFAFPGLSESLDLDSKNLEDVNIPDYMEVTADVKDFSLDMTMTFVMSDILQELDVDQDIDLSGIEDAIDSLSDASAQLVSGSRELADGTGTLLDGINAYTSGVSTLKSGINAYTDGVAQLKNGVDSYTAGVAQVADLCKMPHLLIAGSTGSGKSVCVNSIIISILFRSSPEDVKLMLIDPKVVELAEYNGIPHLLMPVITEPKKAAGALSSAVQEMERRYHLFAENNVRDIKSFNKLAATDPMLEKMPYIAIIIDELADLMMVVGKDVEDSICRIAQKARAAGMHLIVATQRPSVDVITGLIKANIPSRIAFAVSSQVDSRTILDGAGAEKLLGQGDMLFMPVGAPKPVRIQGTFVRDEEISRVLDFIKQSATVQYDEAMIEAMEKHAIQDGKKGAASADADEETGSDPMLKQAVEVVIDAGQASTSLLQRRCKLGYARAARIMDEMEQKGIIGPYEGAKPRAVLISRQQWLEMQMNQPEE